MIKYMQPRDLPSSLLVLAMLLFVTFASSAIAAPHEEYQRLDRPVVAEGWVRPSADLPAQPVWGHANGLRVGISPFPGPRGLLRVYAPYLGQPEPVMINYIALEPVPAGQQARGLSELEFSRLDNVRGKRFWSADDLSDWTARDPAAPARGIVETIDGVESLRVFVIAEPFDNGAKVAVRLTFRADRPHEVGVATFKADDSVELEHCGVTATMGNYARLRQLHLADRIATPAQLWPEYKELGFTPHASFSLNDLQRTAEGDALVAATTDERDPAAATYAPLTKKHWHYEGEPATQTWRMPNPPSKLKALVNGRYVYWGSVAPIPGGLSFENFELVAPFQQGSEFWFGVAPMVSASPTPPIDAQ